MRKFKFREIKQSVQDHMPCAAEARSSGCLLGAPSTVPFWVTRHWLVITNSPSTPAGVLVRTESVWPYHSCQFIF